MALPRYCQLCAQLVDDDKFRDGYYDPVHRAIAGYCSNHEKHEIEVFETALEFKRFADEVYRSPGKRYIQKAKLIPIARIPKLLNLSPEEAADIWDGEIEKFLLSAVREFRTLTMDMMWDIAHYIDETYGRSICERLRQQVMPRSSAGGGEQ